MDDLHELQALGAPTVTWLVIKYGPTRRTFGNFLDWRHMPTVCRCREPPSLRCTNIYSSPIRRLPAQQVLVLFVHSIGWYEGTSRTTCVDLLGHSCVNAIIMCMPSTCTASCSSRGVICVHHLGPYTVSCYIKHRSSNCRYVCIYRQLGIDRTRLSYDGEVCYSMLFGAKQFTL